MFGAFAENELQTLARDRSSFPSGTALGRGGQFQLWGRGIMQSIGSRMASGGRLGDTYAVYPGMEIEGDIERVRKLFKHAKVGWLRPLSRSYHIESSHLGHRDGPSQGGSLLTCSRRRFTS